MTSSTDGQPITPHRARSALGLLVGMVISVLLSSALVYSAAKAGITPGVSPLVVLFGWVVFGSFMRGKLKGFLAIAQVTGSAGAAVTAGMVFTAPIVQIVAEETSPITDHRGGASYRRAMARTLTERLLRGLA